MSEIEKYLPIVWRSAWFQALRRFVTTKEMTLTVPYKHYRLVSVHQLAISYRTATCSGCLVTVCDAVSFAQSACLSLHSCVIMIVLAATYLYALTALAQYCIVAY
jgi:hypothetical protein